MRNLIIEKRNKIRKAIPVIEDKIKVNIGIRNNKVNIKGSELNEFLVERIIKAIDFGFEVEDSLMLKNEEFVLEFIDIRKHTNRRNLHDVRARIIGARGKAKKTIENLTGSSIVINENRIGLISDSENLDSTIQGIESLIQGSKHGNVFSYLEKQNTARKKRYFEEDLGIRKRFEKYKID